MSLTAKDTHMSLKSNRSRSLTSLTSVVGASLLFATFLTAEPPSTASASGTTITVEEASIDVPLFQKYASLFEAQNPGITVNIVGQDFNTLQLNVPRILAGPNPPDVIRLGALGNTVADKQ